MVVRKGAGVAGLGSLGEVGGDAHAAQEAAMPVLRKMVLA